MSTTDFLIFHYLPEFTEIHDQSLLELMTFFVCFFNVSAAPHSLWDLSSHTMDQTCALCVESVVLPTGPPGILRVECVVVFHWLSGDSFSLAELWLSKKRENLSSFYSALLSL